MERLDVGGRVRAAVVVPDRVETPAGRVGHERADLESKVAVVGIGAPDGGSERPGGTNEDSPWREGGRWGEVVARGRSGGRGQGAGRGGRELVLERGWGGQTLVGDGGRAGADGR